MKRNARNPIRLALSLFAVSLISVAFAWVDPGGSHGRGELILVAAAEVDEAQAVEAVTTAQPQSEVAGGGAGTSILTTTRDGGSDASSRLEASRDGANFLNPMLGAFE